MDVKNAIASLFTAGALTLGAANPAQTHARYTPAQAAQSSSGYRSYIKDYIRDLHQNYGDLIPKDNSLHFSFSSGSDADLYSQAMRLHGAVMQNYGRQSKQESKPESGNYHIVPFQSSNGSVYFTDLNGNGQVKMIKNQNGLYSFMGPKDMFEVVFGRGMVNQAVQNLGDNDYWHDKR